MRHVSLWGLTTERGQNCIGFLLILYAILYGKPVQIEVTYYFAVLVEMVILDV